MDFLLVNTLIVISRSVFVATHAVEHSHVHTVPELVTAEGYYVENHYVPTYEDTSSTSIGYLVVEPAGRTTKWPIYNMEFSNHLPSGHRLGLLAISWDELGSIDLPATINYVLERTGTDGIYYVGHSQGTTAYYVMVSTRPEYNEKIRVQVSLAPVAFMKHMTSPLLRFAAFWDRPLNILMQMFGVNEFLPGEGFLSSLTEEICSEGIGPILCQNTLFAICGFSPREVNASVVPVIMSYTPAGSSTKQFFHYAQLVKSGQFVDTIMDF
ncbi:hypothetical protein JTB14_010373 [Gonioctena quinquepunctata]|nr:hypothetical protein JTB14_010373 [Gonioctena quinquepunctata]